MASIVNDPNGRRRIEFTSADGRRRTLRLGKVTAKQADTFRVHVEHLLSAAARGDAPDGDTSRWLAGLGDTMLDRLGRAKLTTRKARLNVTLATLIAEVFAALEVKASTLVMYQQTRRRLFEFFGEGKSIAEIGALDAEKWRQKLKGDELAEATISKSVKLARQFFKQAVRWKMIDTNPFEGVRAHAQTNRARMFFISPADAAKVLEACPDAEWRLLFSLSRYGGLRCPSEHLLLTWADVDWERGRLRVSSPKTEHHNGADHRFVPIFPELKTAMEEAYAQAGEGATHLITRYRQANCNLRTQLHRIIRRAGLSAWPKLFHNLRATRQTELEEVFPSHVVCAWLGNSEKVARAHYLQVTDDHFDRALLITSKATEKATYTVADPSLLDATRFTDLPRNPAESRIESPYVVYSRHSLMSPVGFEQGKDIPGNSESMNMVDVNSAVDPDLAAVIAAWPTLPKPNRDWIAAKARKALSVAGQVDAAEPAEPTTREPETPAPAESPDTPPAPDHEPRKCGELDRVLRPSQNYRPSALKLSRDPAPRGAPGDA